MNIPIIMLTAKVGESDRIHGIDSGADIYLKKPFSIDLLKTHLLQLIKSKERFYETYFNSLDLEINRQGVTKKFLQMSFISLMKTYRKRIYVFKIC